MLKHEQEVRATLKAMNSVTSLLEFIFTNNIANNLPFIFCYPDSRIFITFW